MKACPYRKDFYAKLGPSEEVVRAPLNKWLAALENIVQQMKQFYEYVSVIMPRKLTTLSGRASTPRDFSSSHVETKCDIAK